MRARASAANECSRLFRAACRSPDLAIGVFLRQRVEHGEHGGGSDPGTDQQHGCVRPVEDEGAARCRNLESVAEA